MCNGFFFNVCVFGGSFSNWFVSWEVFTWQAVNFESCQTMSLGKDLTANFTVRSTTDSCQKTNTLKIPFPASDPQNTEAYTNKTDK